MDEFSWFVGLYEGEGCFTFNTKPGRKPGRENRYGHLCLQIKMTDEDTIQRVSKFLGVKYTETNPPSKKEHWKPIYRVRKQGGLNGELMDLITRMKPYLCKRRQEQIEVAIQKCKNLSK